MMTEMGGAFAVTWLVFGFFATQEAAGTEELTGIGLTGIMGVISMTVLWMAFKGADILPQITWMKQMSSTDSLTDTDAWMNTGITLAMQIVGGIVAYALIGQMHEEIFGFTDAATAADQCAAAIAGGMMEAGSCPETFWGTTEWSFDMGQMLGLIAAGAVLSQVMAVDSRWAVPVAVVGMAMVGIVNFESAANMASVLVSSSGDTVNVLLPWLLNGVFIGAGGLLANIINENIPGEEE